MEIKTHKLPENFLSVMREFIIEQLNRMIDFDGMIGTILEPYFENKGIDYPDGFLFNSQLFQTVAIYKLLQERFEKENQ